MKKNLRVLIVFLLCLTFSVKGVQARSYISELFQAGDKIKIEKELNGTSFIAGNEVDVNASINGIGFFAGNELNVNATQEYLFGVGNDISIKKDIEKDLFLAGTNIKIKDSNIKRDAYIAGETIEIDGNVDRNIYIYGNEVDLKGDYKGNVTVYAMSIKVDKSTNISGTLKYNKDANVTGINKNIKTKYYETTKTISFKEYLIKFISSYIHIAVVAIVLIFMFERFFKKSLNQTKEITLKNIIIICGKGFLILIGVPIIAMMLLFSGLFMSVGVIGGIIYGILLYIANIFTAYILANIIDKKYLKKNMNSYLLMIIGLLIIYVVSIIPIIGSLLSFISLIFGLGIAGNMIIELKK